MSLTEKTKYEAFSSVMVGAFFCVDVLRRVCLLSKLALIIVKKGVGIMAWSETPQSSKWVQKLDDGTTTSGGIRTVNVSMGALDVGAWDATKAGNILMALEPVLSKSIVSSIRSVDYSLTDE